MKRKETRKREEEIESEKERKNKRKKDRNKRGENREGSRLLDHVLYTVTKLDGLLLLQGENNKTHKKHWINCCHLILVSSIFFSIHFNSGCNTFTI